MARPMVSHLKDKHPNYVDVYGSHQSRQAGSRWIEWVVARNRALSEVDDPLTRNMSKLKYVCSKPPELRSSAGGSRRAYDSHQHVWPIRHYV
ncbi:hypothetical protein GQ600_1419 [Phytophthora cactorum]|nr:hypothetical protein GQ600_1419 [Phytophthora cactorum]